jgi:hypothetical protein
MIKILERASAMLTTLPATPSAIPRRDLHDKDTPCPRPVVWRHRKTFSAGSTMHCRFGICLSIVSFELKGGVIIVSWGIVEAKGF